jgi:hypothetical protein
MEMVLFRIRFGFDPSSGSELYQDFGRKLISPGYGFRQYCSGTGGEERERSVNSRSKLKTGSLGVAKATRLASYSNRSIQ